jgi:hypothetical protein
MAQEMEPPVELVMGMLDQGMPSSEIVTKLQAGGYANKDIQEALNQAQTKASIEGPEEHEEVEEPNIPAPPTPQMKPSVLTTEQEQPPPAQLTQVQEQPPLVQQPEPIMQFPSRGQDERIEEVAESIIDEKWQKVLEDIGDLATWKEKMRTEVISIKQEVLRVENRFDSLQKAIMGRIKEYDKEVVEVGTDVKALEKLLQNILNPLADNIKELKKITTKLKK